MRVAISGSRAPDPSRGRLTGWTDFDLVRQIVLHLLDQGHYIHVGDAPSGVDAMVQEVFESDYECDQYASDRVHPYEARWNEEGKRAGHNRNAWMISESEMLVALFADGPPTPGTSNAVECARKRGIPVHIYHEGVWS